MNWCVYIIECRDKTLYTGITTDLSKRLLMHEAGKGAKYTKGRGPFSLLFVQSGLSRSEALKLECALKKRTVKEKIKVAEYGDVSILGSGRPTKGV